VPMIAFANVVPGRTYHIKLAIADYGDSQFDSAVFIEAGSFGFGSIDLGENLLQATGNAVCAGGSTVVTTGLNPEEYTFQWYKDSQLLVGEIGQSLIVTEPGEYMMEGSYPGTSCVGYDIIVIEFYPEIVPGPAQDLSRCTTEDSTVFDLTLNNGALLEPLGNQFATSFFLTEEDATNNQNPIANPSAYPSISNPQTIYVRVYNTLRDCFAVVNFDILHSIPTVAQFEPVVQCGCYTLPALANGSYFTETNGSGTMLNANEEICSTQTIFVYAQSGTGTDACSAETNFTVTISDEFDIPTPSPVNQCTPYILPTLEVGQYFTAPNGGGAIVNAGESIAMSQTLYIFATSGTCSDQEILDITIGNMPQYTVTSSCIGNQFTLMSSVENESYNPDSVTYHWSTTDGNISGSETGSSIAVLSEGTYSLVVTSGSCVGQPVDFVVTNARCSTQKGISPNGDGYNDYFDLVGQDVRLLEIFNRYGRTVYKKKNYSNEWYGQTDKGDELPDGTYYYVMERGSGETLTGWIYINREQN